MIALVRLIKRITGSAGLLIAWVIFPLILASCYEVFARYVLNAPTIWAFELGYMAMGTHALIGAAFALRERVHIRIDVLYIKFSDKRKAIVDTIGYLVQFMPVVCGVSLGLWGYWIESCMISEHSGQSAWNPLIWPFRPTFFIGFFLLGLQGLAELIKYILFLTGRTSEWEKTDG